MVNRLAHSTSPYLRQHADNPVDWWEWGEEAFAEARRRDVPVFLSIGYSTCHWCHVMAAESFTDAETAAQLNADYVCIKVDREELPAVDSYYMDALQAMRGAGGWPLTAITDHSGRPFFTGTYFPKDARQGMPAFRQVLTAITSTWKDERAKVDEIAGRLSTGLAELAARITATVPADTAVTPLTDEELDAAVKALAEEHDAIWGGFGGAPKFPPLLTLVQLVRHASRSGDHSVLDVVRTTFSRMATGGMRDQVGGGIARYSVDEKWHVPHFEKMLYDNALLLRAATAWYRIESAITENTAALLPAKFAQLARREAEGAAAFLLNDLRLPDGSFASGLDADSLDPTGAEVEGAFYTFTPDSLSEALAGSAVDPEPQVEDAEAPAAPGTVSASAAGTVADGDPTAANPEDPADDALTSVFTLAGDVEGAAVLVREDILQWLQRGGDTPAPWTTPVSRDQESRVRAVRETRPRPHRDEKTVVEWNALAVTALAEAAVVFDRPEWAEAAGAALAPVVRFLDTGDLPRSFTGERTGPGAAGLADWAQVGRAALALDASWVDSVGGKAPWDLALGCAARIEERFLGTADGTLTVFDSVDPILGVEQSDPIDNTAPAGRTATAEFLLLLSELEDPGAASGEHAAVAHTLLAGYRPLVAQSPRGAGWALYLSEELAAGPVRVATRSPELQRIAAAHPAVFAVAARGPELADLPENAAVVCRGTECSLPLDSADALLAELTRVTTRG